MAGPLEVILARREQDRKRKTAQEGLDAVLAVPKPSPLPTPQPPPRPIFDLTTAWGRNQQSRFESELPGLRLQAIKGLTDAQVRNYLGLEPSDDMTQFRGDPETFVKRSRQSVQLRYQGLWTKLEDFGGPLPGEISPQMELILSQVMKAQAEAEGAEAAKPLGWRGAFGKWLYGDTTTNLSELMLFGNKDIPNPLDTIPANMYLSSTEDLANYVKHKGLLGILFDMDHLVAETGASLSTTMLSSLLAMTGVTPQLIVNLDKRRETDQSLQAVLEAYKETDMPTGVKGLAELLSSPVSWALRVPQMLGKGLAGFGTLAKSLIQDVVETPTIRSFVGKAALPYEARAVGKRTDTFADVVLDGKLGKLVPDAPPPGKFLLHLERPTFWRPQAPGPRGTAPNPLEHARELWGWTKDVTRNVLRPIASIADPGSVVTDPVRRFYMDNWMTLGYFSRTQVLAIRPLETLKPFLNMSKDGLVGSVKTKSGHLVDIDTFLKTDVSRLDTLYDIANKGTRAFHKLWRQINGLH